jgi:hypothetical protein
MIAWRLWGGLNDDMSSEEVDDAVGSRKIWQPEGMSESLRELVFPMAMQRFIYCRTITTMGINDFSRTIATENHSSHEWLLSSARCYCDPYIYSTILK